MIKNKENFKSENRLLPVSKEAVQKALIEIAADPGKEFRNMVKKMKEENFSLFFFINTFGNTLSNDKSSELKTYAEPYLEGSFWTYKLLLTQSLLKNIKFPIISQDVFLKNAEKQSILYRSNDIPLDIFWKRTFRKFEEFDPNAAFMIKEISKYRIETAAIYGGSNDFYSYFKFFEESKGK